MTRIRSIAGVVAAGCAVATLSAMDASQQRGAPPAAAAARPPVQLAPGTGFILGRVVEAGATTGVPNARVTISGPALGSAQLNIFTDGTPAGSRDAGTDAQGNFLFRNLPRGTYQLSAIAPGFVNGVYGQGRPFQLRRTLDVVGNVDVNDAEKVTGITIPLWRTAGIIGTVVDDAGEAMVGVPVTVLHRTTDWGGAFMAEAVAVPTDDRGMFHADVTPGDYVVAVIAPPTAIPVSVVDDYQQAIGAGPPVPGAVLEAMSSSNAPSPNAGSVRAGNFLVSSMPGRSSVSPSLPGLVRGGVPELYITTYYPGSASAASASVLSLESGEERNGINIQLRRQAAHRVSGRVSGPAGTGGNLGVRLVIQDPATSARMNPMFISDAPQTVTDANGAFTFFGVGSGAYTLRIFKNAKAADPILWALQAVTVGETDVRDLSVELHFGSRISGHVEFDSSVHAPPAAALTRMTFTPRALPGSNGAYIVGQRGNAASDDHGVFSLGQLVPGPYMLTVAGIPSGWALKSVTTRGHEVIDAPFELGASDLDDMVVTITDRVSRIIGTLRDTEGRPVPTASVGVFPADKAHWRLPGMPSPRVQTVSPDRSARYVMEGLPAGDYLIVAVDRPVDFSDPAVLTALIGSAAHLAVTDGDTKTLDLKVVVMK